MTFDELNKFDLGYNGFTDFEAGHQYKIGQKVKSIKNGQEYYIVGIKGKSIRDYELDNTMLIVHFEKDKPSRFGFAVRPCQVEVVVSWQDYYN